MSHLEIPELIDYPELFNLNSNFELFNNVYCNIVEKYDQNGINLYIGIRGEYKIIKIADFNSCDIDINSEYARHILSHADKFLEIMSASRIPNLSFYFSDNYLVDVMVSVNKFMSPGMINDLFGNYSKTQKIIDIVNIDDNNVNSFKNVIIKPSRFRYTIDENIIRPVYGVC